MSIATDAAVARAGSYFDRHFQRQARKILPGEFYSTGQDEVIVTVLGSCVAACLMDPVCLVGGMNHFMLPALAGALPDDRFSSARYGVAAMEFLINDMFHQGGQRSRLVAKVFGGGNVMNGHGEIGGQNIQFIRSYLEKEDIPIWAEDLGGVCPRKIYFFPRTGQVLVKQMNRLNNDTLTRRETVYLKGLGQSPGQGDVELFT